MLEQLPEFRETHLQLSYVMKYMMKDRDEQPNEIHRVRSGRAQRTGVSVPEDWEYTTFSVHGYVHQPGSSQNPVLMEFLWKLHYTHMIKH